MKPPVTSSFRGNPYNQQSANKPDEERDYIFCSRRVCLALLSSGPMHLSCIPTPTDTRDKGQYQQTINSFFERSIDIAINRNWISVNRTKRDAQTIYHPTTYLQLVETCLQGDLDTLKHYKKESHNFNYWLESIRDDHQGIKICPLIAGIESRKKEVREYLESQSAIFPEPEDKHLKNNILHYLAKTPFIFSACHVLKNEPELLTAKNKNGMTPIDIALSCQNENMLRILKNKFEKQLQPGKVAHTSKIKKPTPPLSPEINQTTSTARKPSPKISIPAAEMIKFKNKKTDFDSPSEDLINKMSDFKIFETDAANDIGSASAIADEATTLYSDDENSNNSEFKDFIKELKELQEWNRPCPIVTIRELDSVSFSTSKKTKKTKKQDRSKKSKKQPANKVTTTMQNQLTNQPAKPLQLNESTASNSEYAVIPAKSEHLAIKDNPELTAKNSLKGSTYPVEKTDNSNDKGSHPPIYQEEQKPSPDTTIPPAMEMANNQEIRAPKQPDRTRRQSRRQPRRQPRKQPRKQPIATLPAAVPTLKTEPLTVPSLQLDQSPCIKTRIDNIIPRKNDLSKQNEDRELLEHISDILDISISVYDRGTGQSNLTANGETAPCADNTTYAQPEKAHIKHRNIIEAKQKCTITSSKTQRNTLPLFRFMESDRPRLDSREVRDTRTYYQNKLDDLIINKKLPVVFAGSIACLKQMHALWGKNVIDRITPQPWPEIIDKETLESALTPRDTDLLVASKEQLDDVINAITDQMRNALLTQHKLNVSPKETRIYYNTECTVCKVTFEPHSTRKPGDVAYVVDLIAGPDFGTPESCNFSTISEANRTKRVDEIIMDEFRFITTVSLGGPKRACKAFARIFTLATLEYLEPRLDTLARFALLRVLNAYPAERIFKEYSNELRKRAFHVVCDNGKIIGARLQDS